jgi:hypothetical protein
MREARKKRKSRRQDAALRRAGKHAAVAKRVSDLVWAGQHAQAIKLVTEALAEPGLSVGAKLDLPGSRAESFIAHGELEHASANAQAMLDLAECKTPAFKAHALRAALSERIAVEGLGPVPFQGKAAAVEVLSVNPRQQS